MSLRLQTMRRMEKIPATRTWSKCLGSIWTKRSMSTRQWMQMGFSLDGCRGKAQVHPPCATSWMSTSFGTRQTMFLTFPYFPEESVLRSQSADVEVACSGQFIPSGHAMIQPLQRNWRWFQEQRGQCAYLAFLEFLLTCFYLHSLKVSQLEKESQEQRERCKMLSAELENANNLKDVLEETVLRWKSFGIPECDVEVHATDSGQFLPPTLPMTPRDSNNLKAKDVRADGPSDASTTMPNLGAENVENGGSWSKCQSINSLRVRNSVPIHICGSLEDRGATRTVDLHHSLCDVESLNKASSPASEVDTHSGAPDVASETEATESSRFLQLIRLQDGSAENGSEFLPTELFPMLLDFLPVDEVVMFDVRAVSRFFASPKAWAGYSICSSWWTSTLCQHCPLKSRCIQLWSAFTSPYKQKMKSLRLREGEGAWPGSTCWEHQNVAEVFFSGDTTFTGGSCINLTWYAILLMFVLKTLTTNLVFSGGWQCFCMRFIGHLNCDCASPVAWWTLRALPRSKQLFARHWICFASLSLSINASTGISWQSSSGLWLLMKHCSAAASTE